MVARDHEPLGLMPACLIRQDERMSPGRNRVRDLFQVQAHPLGHTPGEDKPCSFALSRTDRPEEVGRGGPLVLGS